MESGDKRKYCIGTEYPAEQISTVIFNDRHLI